MMRALMASSFDFVAEGRLVSVSVGVVVLVEEGEEVVEPLSRWRVAIGDVDYTGWSAGAGFSVTRNSWKGIGGNTRAAC